ncbi:glutamine--fructose-6-phosphate transaminase (isomerizing) [Granulicella mallensis]|uniref:Glutamine--fructose-6-phosphate aminotransferase [isomerizing] n=1 Tax=Granulicella mallensis (strain ATCC BAA-1857 / DSM 23137 / MP5ACTX8) TaxID=682795 RepID=G8NYK5_GRAMM|nr:glutamine--fructose-6-phosphate transaminase (isomerizing) [Granulicella mallensis]AEU39064.1 glucosamine/fructose-6-phosphate aminotransferase, isomerizing [Granulicella mallensis MP5ACTX8]
MCGIVGYIGPKPCVPVIMEGLARLEYRGYDSAGIAVAGGGHALQLRRAPGKLRNLDAILREDPVHGTYGIGHTRWATHGRPTEENAHPHRDGTGTLVVVHNGIVENYLQLKNALIAKGHKFASETDTEIIAHVIQDELELAVASTRTDAALKGTGFSPSINAAQKAGALASEAIDGSDESQTVLTAPPSLSLEEAVRRAVKRLTGAFAIGVLSAHEPDKLVAARMGPPAVLGIGEGEYFLASDVPGILHHTRTIYFLQDGEVATLTTQGIELTDFAGQARTLTPQRITWDPIQAEKAGYKHFMLKEINEQPRAVRDTTLGRVSLETGKVFLPDMKISPAEFRAATGITIAACGTSWHAGLAGKFMIERLARLPVDVDYASEYRYRDPIPSPTDIGLLITQSGETADTIAAQHELIAKGSKTLAICNVVGAAVTRLAQGTITTNAGPEIGVASTKAFTAQLTALFTFALYLAQVRGTVDDTTSLHLVTELSRVPGKIEEILRSVDDQCHELAKHFSTARDFLFLGRGIHYPIALEGALKLKEISYIHAEGYPAGEMKHGPNALIDETLPVVCIATKDPSDPSSVLKYEKTLSNIQEVTARSGRVIAIAIEGDEHIGQLVEHVIHIPQSHELLLPILEVVPLQLLAYHIAVRRGCDVDQPRNLAKSVTVE